MKKIIIIILFLLHLMPIASAQIQVKKAPTSKTLISLRMGMVSLSQIGDNFYLVLQSDNQYDKAYVIHLGKEKAASIQSLESLIEIASTIKKDDFYQLDNTDENLTIMRGLVKTEIWIKGRYHAGYGKTSKGELEKILDKLTFEVY